MSDLNDLIHITAHNAYAIGVKTEQERIIKMLLDWDWNTREENNWRDDSIALGLIALIKAEQ